MPDIQPTKLRKGMTGKLPLIDNTTVKPPKKKPKQRPSTTTKKDEDQKYTGHEMYYQNFSSELRSEIEHFLAKTKDPILDDAKEKLKQRRVKMSNKKKNWRANLESEKNYYVKDLGI